MSRVLLLWIPLCLWVSACTKKVTQKVTPAPVVVKEAEEDVIPPDLPLPDDIPSVRPPKGIDDNLIVRIQKTACFGKCPVFTVEIYRDGKAVYSGVAYTKRKGRFETTIEKEFIQKIHNKAADANFWKLKNTYPDSGNVIADIPSTITYIRQGNNGKLITNNYDAPKSLIALEKWLQSEIDNLDWKEAKE